MIRSNSYGAGCMKNVAIFGGSFDPVHTGHVFVVGHLLLNEPSIDEVVVIPCFQQKGKNLINFDLRYEMCYLAFKWLPKVTVSNIEKDLGGESYTVRTLQTLAAHNYDWKMRFVLGADLLDSVHSWGNWDEIEKLAPPIVVGRAGVPSVGGGATPICPAISSTLIKDLLRSGNPETAQRYLPKKVFKFIKENNLYIEKK